MTGGLSYSVQYSNVLFSSPQQFVRSEDRDGRGSVATKSVGAQFSAQLRELRSRIDTTVPHYIRCLKPNDELVPNSFDPKMIVDQLRCGGVLEAVRVSRAGYPTRYPHDVFKARYYILGDFRDKLPVSPYGNKKRFSMSEDDLEIKKLISRIAFEIWEADHEAMMVALGQESNTPIKVGYSFFHVSSFPFIIFNSALPISFYSSRRTRLVPVT